ncbi:MAG TPA: DUF1761 domain-containing protein [Candidatus Kapabacteria bacterium]|nr:DUF1761 domain-containing protein [Candidatus Kapabacteria bacterium]
MGKINHLAVLVSVVLHQALGFVWYSAAPWAAGRLAALGRPATDAAAVDPAGLAADIIGWIAASYVIAWLVRKANATTMAGGMLIGCVLWLGIGLPALVPHYIFAGIRPVVTVIDGANILVACLITGAIMGRWSGGAR